MENQKTKLDKSILMMVSSLFNYINVPTDNTEKLALDVLDNLSEYIYFDEGEAKRQMANTFDFNINGRIESMEVFLSDRYNFDKKLFKQETRKSAVVFSKNIIFTMLKCLTEKSLNSIGKEYEKSHATVLHSIKNVKRDIEVNSPLTADGFPSGAKGRDEVVYIARIFDFVYPLIKTLKIDPMFAIEKEIINEKELINVLQKPLNLIKGDGKL
jgi:hypothetical protein